MYTSKEAYKRIEDSKIKRSFKRLSAMSRKLDNGKHEITKYDVAEFVESASFCRSLESAVLVIFQVDPKSLLKHKDNKKLLTLLFEMAQAKLDAIIMQRLLSEPNMANSIKVLAQITDRMDSNDDKSGQIKAVLNVDLSKKKPKKQPKHVVKDNKTKPKAKPLMLLKQNDA